MPTPAVTPNSFMMSVTETLALSLDGSAYLGSGQTVTNPTVTLFNQQTETYVDGLVDPSLSGNIITQLVRGPTDLIVGCRYLLNANFTAAPSSNVWSMQLVIVAVP